jgi:hypothetical protein
MTTHRSDFRENMRLLSGILLTVLLYAIVIYLAIVFSPPEIYITDDWREAQKFSRECEGHVTTEEIMTIHGRQYEMTCEEKDETD